MRKFWTSLAKPFVLLAYRLRERRRFKRNFPTRWLSQDRLVQDDLDAHAELEGSASVGDDFLATMAGARDAYVKAALRYRTASLAITGYFLLAVLSIDMPVSAFGIVLERVSGLNELLLISSAILGAFSSFHASKTATLESAIKAVINLKYKPPLLNFYRTAYLPNEYSFLFYPSYSPHLVWDPLKIKHAAASTIAALTFIFVALICMFAFRGYVTWWVWSSPTSENLLLKAAIWIAPVLDLGSFLFLIAYIVPLPHRDYFKLQQLGALEDLYPADFSKLQSDMYDDGTADRTRLREAGFLPPL